LFGLGSKGTRATAEDIEFLLYGDAEQVAGGKFGRSLLMIKKIDNGHSETL
jgi:hypothetical protein